MTGHEHTQELPPRSEDASLLDSQSRSAHAPHAPRRGSAFRYLRLAFRCGLLFAEIQRQMERDQPLDPEETWRYWTEPKNPLADWLAAHWPPRRWRRSFLVQMISQDHASGIEAHYDVSNDFYRLWLDQEYLFYTCAKFDSPRDSLDEAQRNKAEFLGKLLDPKAGEKILDLGCGWGGMMKAIIASTGDKENLAGISLSQPQVSYVRNELGFRCEYGNFIERQYPPGSLDKIYSIGSMEHVRPDEIKGLHDKLFQALPPGGRVVHQFFSTDRDPFSTSMVALQQFFPGSMLSRHQDMIAGITEAGFRIEVDVTDDYRPTLRAWFDNLVANKTRALRCVDVRTYNRYLLFFPAAWRFFHDGNARLHRMLLIRP